MRIAARIQQPSGRKSCPQRWSSKVTGGERCSQTQKKPLRTLYDNESDCLTICGDSLKASEDPIRPLGSSMFVYQTPTFRTTRGSFDIKGAIGFPLGIKPMTQTGCLAFMGSEVSSSTRKGSEDKWNFLKAVWVDFSREMALLPGRGVHASGPASHRIEFNNQHEQKPLRLNINCRDKKRSLLLSATTLTVQ